jgi:hypothetical protein
MSSQKTELLNQPAVGLSELAATLQALAANVKEGLDAGIFGHKLKPVHKVLRSVLDACKLNC